MTTPTLDSSFTTLPDLAAERLGGSVVVANDEFFAPKENLIKPNPPNGVKANTPNAESGWTDGKRVGDELPATIG